MSIVLDGISTKYLAASGPSARECVFLAQRWDQRYGDRGSSEMWVMRLEPEPPPSDETGVWYHAPTAGQYAGLWRSLTGAVYVADASNRCVRSCPALEGQTMWTNTPLAMSPYGVWGLDDRCVIVWGCCGHGPDAPMTFPMARFDGRAWQPMTDPGFEVFAVHGLAPDNLVAVGVDGQISRFNGKRWTEMTTPILETLTAVCMVSGDEIYAVSDGGALLESKRKKLELVAHADPETPFALTDVAWWQGELWLAGGLLGLLRRVGRSNELEVAKPDIIPLRFDARVDLVVTMHDRIVGTSNGKQWITTAEDSLQTEFADRPLLFFQQRAG